MKTTACLAALTALILAVFLTGCADTGFFREVPVARQGGFDEFRFRVLEAPEWWSGEFNPLDRADDPATVEEIRIRHMQAITSNPGWQPQR